MRYLLGGLEYEWIIFHNIWVVILPIDELIFVKMVKTTNQEIFEAERFIYCELLLVHSCQCDSEG